MKTGLLLFQDQKDRVYSTVRSKSTSATVNNLKPSTAYVFQIRAFTEAGYGTYGPRLEITTKEEATGSIQSSTTHFFRFTCAFNYASFDSVSPLRSDPILCYLYIYIFIMVIYIYHGFQTLDSKFECNPLCIQPR